MGIIYIDKIGGVFFKLLFIFDKIIVLGDVKIRNIVFSFNDYCVYWFV